MKQVLQYYYGVNKVIRLPGSFLGICFIKDSDVWIETNTSLPSETIELKTFDTFQPVEPDWLFAFSWQADSYTYHTYYRRVS